MIIDRQDNIALITQESLSLSTFVKRFVEAYPKLTKENIILNLLSISNLSAGDLLEFLDYAREHRQNDKSFVMVTDAVNYDEVHKDLSVVPTLQEAYDLIEMEDIERDLNAD